MKYKFDKIKISETLWLNFPLKSISIAVITILITIMWARVVWLSPYTSGTEIGIAKIPENVIENSIQAPVVKHADIAIGKITRQTNAYITNNSQAKLIPESDYQPPLASVAIEDNKTPINKHSNITKPVETDTTPVEDQKGLFISGMVYDHTGNPIPDITLIAQQKKPNIEDRDRDIPASKRQRQTTTESDGFYQVQDLEDGEYEIRSKISDLYQETSIIVHTGIESADLILRKKQTDIRIFGSVQSEGERLENVRIVPNGQSTSAVYTDTEGCFDMVVDISSRLKMYPLKISHQDYKVQISELRSEKMLKQGEMELNLELEPINELAEVTGVLLISNNSPVSEEKAQLYSKTTNRSYFAISDRDGAFWFPEVASATDYFLSVHPAGYYQDYQQKENVHRRSIEIPILVS